MVPSPMLIDMEQDNKMDVSLKAPLNQDDGSLRCTNNCEDTNFDMDTMLYQETMSPDTNDNSEVEVVECTNTSDNIRLPQGDDPDATEYSSSFADTVSLNDDGSRLSDAEVESEYYGDNGLGFDGFGSFLSQRKKKLTDHWRSYIRPLMWRCKWVELRMKEFRSQASKYNTELAECLRVKQLELGQHSQGCGRTLPFCRQVNKRKAMKRRKRKKVEDTTDIPSFMSSHNLFSHYEKKSDADGASADEDCGNPVMADVNGSDEPDGHYHLTSFECKDGDNSVEQILWKIEIAQSKAKRLKTVVDKLLMEHAGKFSSMENLSIFASSDMPSSSARSPTFSPGHGDAMPIGALYTPPGHISEYEIGDLVIPDSAVSSYVEEIPISNVIHNPVGLSTAAQNPLDQPHVGAASINVVDNILIDNRRAAGKGLMELEKVSGTAPVKVKEEIVEERNNIVTLSSNLVPEPATTVQLKKIVPKEEIDMTFSLCADVNVPKNKRKRGERKPGSGAWNSETISTQRSSGEPDNS